jgi:hypothetical protein
MRTSGSTIRLNREPSSLSKTTRNFKRLQSKQELLEKTRGNNSIFKNTFNTKLKANRAHLQISGYEYYKEKKLLEFLSLKSKKDSRVQKEIQKRLNDLKKNNIDIEDEKKILLRKLNSFNPLDVKEIRNYLEQTEKNQVKFPIKFIRKICKLFAQG